MICNVGGVDRTVRILVGIVFSGGAIFFNPSMVTKVSLFVIAGLSFITAWLGFCMINKLLGINTARQKTISV